jgi:ribosomal protein L37AE/L43A
MSAKKTGGTAGRLRAKNSAMAAAMKAEGIQRHTAKCPVCHRAVAISSMYAHIVTCK